LIAAPLLDPQEALIFTRVGAVTPNSANIVLRYPPPHSFPNDSNDDQNIVAHHPHHIRLIWREYKENASDTDGWRRGPTLELIQEHDWTATAQLTSLWPATLYEYTLQKADTTPGQLDYPGSSRRLFRFITFPDARLATQSGSKFKFLASSCMLPNFPYVPGEWLTIRGFDMLADYILPHHKSKDRANQEKDQPTHAFMLFLGDFIYADVPFYYGKAPEAYRRLYRRVYGSPSFRRVYESGLPIINAYDDHEFVNNFSGQHPEKLNEAQELYNVAAGAYDIYNGQANYVTYPGEQYFSFRYADAEFFVLDTRRYRTTSERHGDDSAAEDGTHTMLGTQQMDDLRAWIAKANRTSTFKFIVSSVPVTSLWFTDAASDTWAGFSAEKETLMTLLHSVPNVVILSGDRHEFAAVEFTPPSDLPYAHRVYEFSTSPLNMFYMPILRTLKSESKDKVLVRTTDAATAEVVEHEVPKERVIKYIATGNRKWASIEVDTRSSGSPVLRVAVAVDGKDAWTYEVEGQAVDVSTGAFATDVAMFVQAGLKDMWAKMGLDRASNWI
ncbi:Metallo-dependent phosphatase, partial [Fistulina hepatica ATCC 64428]